MYLYPMLLIKTLIILIIIFHSFNICIEINSKINQSSLDNFDALRSSHIQWKSGYIYI